MSPIQTGGIKLGFNKFGGNLQSHKRWLEYLVGDSFYPAMKKRVEKRENVRLLQKHARSIIEIAIYNSVPEGPNYVPRTKALLRSFIAIAGSADGDAELIVYSDTSTNRGTSGVNKLNPTGSPLAITGQGAGVASYAIFFEDEHYGSHAKSFIQPSGTPVRPYMKLITDFVNWFMLQRTSEAFLTTVKTHMPTAKP